MIINNVQFNCELSDIIQELQAQLRLNDIPLIQKTIDTNNDIMIQCPYHGNGQERKPSAGIKKTDGTFHCFACGEVHSLPEVISYCFGHYEDVLGSFGWQWLNKNFATVAVEERKEIEIDFSRTDNSIRNSNSSGSGIRDNFVQESELDRYRYYHPYWRKRGITDEKIIELFDLGYDKVRECITMPVRDKDGNCLFIARRSVKTKFFNYPAGVEKPLYGLYELYETFVHGVVVKGAGEKVINSDGTITIIGKIIYSPEEVIVCESMIDALTAWQFGKYAVALNGLGTELQFKQLRELPCRKLILATDNDKAGMRARDRIRKNVKNKIITEYEFPDGVKDLNDLKDEGFDRLVEVF